MNSRYISHDGTALADILRRVNFNIDEMERELDSLEAEVELVRSRWDGDAQNSYLLAQRRWDRSIRELHAIARTLTNISSGGSERFSAHDQAHANVWRI